MATVSAPGKAVPAPFGVGVGTAKLGDAVVAVTLICEGALVGRLLRPEGAFEGRIPGTLDGLRVSEEFLPATLGVGAGTAKFGEVVVTVTLNCEGTEVPMLSCEGAMCEGALEGSICDGALEGWKPGSLDEIPNPGELLPATSGVGVGSAKLGEVVVIVALSSEGELEGMMLSCEAAICEGALEIRLPSTLDGL